MYSQNAENRRIAWTAPTTATRAPSSSTPTVAVRAPGATAPELPRGAAGQGPAPPSLPTPSPPGPPLGGPRVEERVAHGQRVAARIEADGAALPARAEPARRERAGGVPHPEADDRGPDAPGEGGAPR